MEGALWKAVAPVAGPYGDQLTQERNKVSSIWRVTSKAAKSGKIEDIMRFFNWCYTPEGSALYSYGIEGISYQMKEGAAVLEKALTQNGFDSYREVGCNIESFGGLWQEDAFMQCLFAGKEEAELNDMDRAFYEGIAVVNEDYFYTMPKVYETEAYIKYRDSVLVSALCQARNRTIKGELTTEEFWKEYEALKPDGLQKILDDTAALAEKLKSTGEVAQ